jgi:hypothetical protein
MLGLTIATVIFAAILIVKGTVVAWGGKGFLSFAQKFLYNRTAGIVLWGIAVAWTLVETMKLGPADFGSFKYLLFALFAFLGVASVWMLKDYLVVRGVALLHLYICWWFLKAAFLQPEWTRLFLVVPVYLTIVAALWLTVAPWRVRDLIKWMGENPKGQKMVGLAHLVYGVLLLVVAGTYRFFV